MSTAKPMFCDADSKFMDNMIWLKNKKTASRETIFRKYCLDSRLAVSTISCSNTARKTTDAKTGDNKLKYWAVMIHAYSKLAACFRNNGIYSTSPTSTKTKIQQQKLSTIFAET